MFPDGLKQEAERAGLRWGLRRGGPGSAESSGAEPGNGAGGSGGPGTARQRRVRLPPGNQWAGGRGRPGKRKGKRPAAAAGSARPDPPHPAGRSPAAPRAAGGGGTTGRGGAPLPAPGTAIQRHSDPAPRRRRPPGRRDRPSPAAFCYAPGPARRLPLRPPSAAGVRTRHRVREGFASPKCRAAAPRCSRPARSRPPSRPAAARAGGPGSPRRPTPPAPWNLAPPSPPRCHGHCLSDGRALPRSSRRQAVKRGYGRGKGKEAEPGREGGRWGGTPAGQGGAGRGELPGAGGRRRAEGPRGRCLAGVCGRTPTARFVPCARTAFYSRCRKRSFCSKTRRERSLGAVYKALSRDLGSQHHRGWRRSPAPIRAPAPQRHIPRPLRSLLSGRGSASGVT